MMLSAIVLSAACGSSGSTATGSPADNGGGNGGPAIGPQDGVDKTPTTVAACTSTPQPLYAPDNIVVALTMDAENLYVVGRTVKGDSIWRIPKSGAAPVEIGRLVTEADEAEVQDIAVDDGFVYWVTLGNGETLRGSVGRVPVTGGAAETLTANRPINFHGRVVAAKGFVYWTEANDGPERIGNVARMAIAGGDVSTIATNADQRIPTGLAVAGGHVYFTVAGDDDNSSSGGKQLLRVGLTSDTAEVVADKMGLADALASNATSILYDDGPSVEVLPLGGGSPSAHLDVMFPTAIAVDADSAYVIQGSSIVRRAPLDGSSPPMDLTDGAEQGALEHIAVDDKCVYWTNWEKGIVYMLQK
jgi:hypothetical protein